MSNTKKLEYDLETLPWLDRPARQVDDYVASLDPQPEDPETLRLQLIHWMCFGYAVLPGAIEPQLIDALMADIDELFRDAAKHNTLIDSDLLSYQPIHKMPFEEVEKTRLGKGTVHLRILDFYCYSVAAKRISLHEKITGFLRHVFHDDLVVLQSLNFATGSEQAIHQDFAFVPAAIPSQLAASWVALEDVHPDSGPLAYIPGSQYIRKYDWDDGFQRTANSTNGEGAFAEHIYAESRRGNFNESHFCPKKGDVFIWHSALAHGGTPVRDKARTRWSYVTHYSQASTHFHHFGDPSKPAEREAYPGGFFLKSPHDPGGWNTFRNAEKL